MMTPGDCFGKKIVINMIVHKNAYPIRRADAKLTLTLNNTFI